MLRKVMVVSAHSYGLVRRRHCVLPVGQAREGSARSPQGSPRNALHVYYAFHWLQQSPARPCHAGDVFCQLCTSHCALVLCRWSDSWPATWAGRPPCTWTVPGRSQVRRNALLQMDAGQQLMRCRQQRLPMSRGVVHADPQDTGLTKGVRKQ